MGEEPTGDVATEGDEFVAFGGLCTEGEGEPEDEGAAPFNSLFEETVEVFLAGDLKGAVAFADTDAVGESVEVVLG